MNNNKFFRNAYPSEKNSMLHGQRDADSLTELMPLIIGRGYEYEGLLLNFASHNGSNSSTSDSFTPPKGSLIVMTTRPPLDDEDEGGHLVIGRSGTKLENDIFNSLRAYLSSCSRRQIILNSSFADKFKSGYEDRVSIQFTGHAKKTGHLNYSRYQMTVDNSKKITEWSQKDGIRTAAYFIYTGSCDGGFDLLVSFGMTGTCSLLWSHLVRTKFPYFMDSYRICVAEMIIGGIPDAPTSLRFCEDWDVRILLHQEL